MEFFRKYQRFFFIFITVMVIASFSFFGVFTTFSNEEVREDPVIGEALDGSPIKLSQIQLLSRFLSSDREDLFSMARDLPNFCNDGVIRHDLLKTGLAHLLVASYFDALKEDLDHRLEKIKKYNPYMHPEAPSLSARAVWARYMPSMLRELDGVQSEEVATLGTFTHLSALYLQQSHCPPEFLRRVLLYHTQQIPRLKADPRLQYDDLSLFGFHSLSDWFGHDFVDLASEFILNGARAAEERGYRVSLEEARADLLRNFNASMQKMSEVKNRPDLTFRQHLRILGFDERSAAEVWRDVLLFRRYFHGVGDATFVDRLPYRDFASYALEKAVVQVYRLPPSLRLKTFQDLVEFQVYLRAVSHVTDPLAIPSSFLSLDEIEKRSPQLVQTVYRVRMGEISKAEIGLKAQLKALWDWQLDERNWEALRRQFSFLPKAETREERLQTLEKLDVASREQVDQYSRLKWVDSHPEVASECAASSPLNEVNVSVSKNWTSLKNIEKSGAFISLLESFASGDEEAKRALSSYSGDGQVFYRIEQIEKISDRHLLTFEEAKKSGVIAQAVDQFLRAEYPNIRVQMSSRFQTKEGEWKPFASVKEEVAKVVFADLLKVLGGEDPSLASHRFERYAKEALVSFQKSPDDPKWLQGSGDPIADQFKFEKTQCEIQRAAQEEWMVEQAFVMVPNQWSSVHIPADGDIVFFYFEGRKSHQEPIFEQIAFGKETIAVDAQRYLAERLLDMAKKKHAITIPIQREKE